MTCSQSAVSLPSSSRRTTDIIFLLLIVCCWIAMTIIGFSATGVISTSYISKGNPNLLIYGVDYQGNICGIDEPVKSLNKIWRPNLFGTSLDSSGTFVPPLFSICTQSCPQKGDEIADSYGNYGYWTAEYDTKSFANTCLYSNQNDGATSAVSILSDFTRTAGIIALAGFLLAVIISFLFLLVVRIPLILRGLVWLSICVIFILLAVGGYALLTEAQYQQSKSTGQQSQSEIYLLKALGGVLLGFAFIWLCIVCFMRQRIALAIGLIRESAVVLTTMPILCLLPFLQTVIFAGFSSLWMCYCIYLVSAGTPVTHTDQITGLAYKTISYNLTSQRAILFMFFCWFWSVGFVEALGQIISSHAVVTWYFADSRSSIGSFQVFRSIGTTLRYHCGTAAMGSLVIAIVRVFRMILEYIKLKLTTSHNTRIVRYFLCLISCIMLIFEKCIKFLNKHAYIQCAIFGTPFLVSSRRAFILIIRNLGRLAAVTVVGDFVVLVGKICITLICASIGYFYMVTYMSDELSGFVFPTLFIGFLAFITATMFLGVLSATADALLQACIVDEELKIGKAAQSNKGLRDLIVVDSDKWKIDSVTSDKHAQELYDSYDDAGEYDMMIQQLAIASPAVDETELKLDVEYDLSYKSIPSPLRNSEISNKARNESGRSSALSKYETNARPATVASNSSRKTYLPNMWD
eukprot:gene6534-8977_t